MLKVVTRNAFGQPTVFLGLTKENVQRLRDNQPIGLDMGELGLGDGKIVLLYGEDQAELVDDLRSLGIPLPDMCEPQPGESITGP